MTKKTHYRKVFKSDHLGSADLEDFLEHGSELIFTIKEVRQHYNEKVAGKEINCNVAYFVEKIKPLVLNATNSATLKKLTNSSFVEDWNNLRVQLYIDDNVRLAGERVCGVRIRPKLLQASKAELTPENTVKWNQAIAAFERDGNLKKVLARMEVSKENQELIISQAKKQDAD